MRHEESRKCHLQLRDIIEEDPEMAQMLELWDSNFKSLVLIFKCIKNSWEKGRKYAWNVGKFEQIGDNKKQEWNRNIKDIIRKEQYIQWA